MSFFDRIAQRATALDSMLCVGLDPHLEQLSEPTAAAAQAFCERIIEATKDLAVAFKPNAAFFEQFGGEGLVALKAVIAACGEVPVLLDVKRGDIFSTAKAYAHSAYEDLGADGVTLNAYMGLDAVQPFLEGADKGAFILCRTSNPSGGEVQELTLASGEPLYVQMARLPAQWGMADRVGLVVGATVPAEMARVREEALDCWILAPGIGAQGGDLKAAIKAGLRGDGLGLLLPISRGISKASDPRVAAAELVEQMRIAKDEVMAEGLRRGGLRDRVAKGLLDAGCVRFGEFTLKSGLLSPIYLDLRRLVGFPGLLRDVAALYAEVMESLDYDLVAPLPYAAMPIGSAVSLLTDVPMIYPRKEVKKYGTKALVEGVFEAGRTAVVLDDLATTGGSKIEGLEKLHAVDLKAKDVVVLIDRESGAKELMAEHGIDMHSAFTMTELLDRWLASGDITAEMSDKVRAFIASTRS